MLWHMRNHVLLPAVAWLLCSIAHAQTNLIRNAGFESPPDKRGLPGEGWWLYEARGLPEVKTDTRSAHGGGASVRLHAPDDAKFVLVSPRCEVSPGDELHFKAWVRSDKLPAGAMGGYAGLAFRDATGRVFERAYFQPDTVGNEWKLVSGTAKAPAIATHAEVHLGYTNAPASLWFDDVQVAITSPLSFSLVSGAQPWPGDQEVTVRVINRQPDAFRGSVHAVVARKTSHVPVQLAAGESRLVKVPLTLAGVGQHKYKLSLLDATGATLRTLEGNWRTAPPLTLFPAVPCYHAVGEGSGETRLDARISVNPAQRAGLRLAVEATDTAGKVLQSATAVAAKGEFVGAKLRLPVDQAGAFELGARLLDAAGKELGSARTEVKIAPRAASQVALEPNGFLRVAGQPQFVIGMYSCGRYDEMGKAGFTGTHNYGITTGDAADAINPNDANVQRLLDQSLANGMRMMVEFPRKAVEKAQWEQIRRRILTFRRHPGLLCWGSEERVARGEAPLAHIVALYQLVKELDPDHPLVLGDTRDVIGKFQKDRRNFFPDECMDVGIWWWYPIPLHAPDASGVDSPGLDASLLRPPPWLTTTLSKKPLWIAIQSYQQPRKDARFPTPAEYRAMAYLSIINGVKGLWFYTGSGQRDWQGKPAGLLNKPEEGRWDYVQQLVRELRELSPVIMAKASAAKLELAPADAPVEFATRELDGKFYVLAANKSDREQSVRFAGSVLAGRKTTVLYEDHTATIQGETLEDKLGGFGVRVYRIE